MNVYKKTCFLFSVFLSLLFLNACDKVRLVAERPILEVPDGNKDRMEKTVFSGTPEDPKYWLSRHTIVKNDF